MQDTLLETLLLRTWVTSRHGFNVLPNLHHVGREVLHLLSFIPRTASIGCDRGDTLCGAVSEREAAEAEHEQR